MHKSEKSKTGIMIAVGIHKLEKHEVTQDSPGRENLNSWMYWRQPVSIQIEVKLDSRGRISTA